MTRTAHSPSDETLKRGARLLQRTRIALAALLAGSALSLPSSVGAGEGVHYAFPAAAQEFAQTLWLAETAHACGWASHEQVERFEAFVVRFLAAHLEGSYRSAFYALVNDSRYVSRIEKLAADNARESCAMARWQRGWNAYQTAALENEGNF